MVMVQNRGFKTSGSKYPSPSLAPPPQVPWVNLYGPEGWCEADAPKFKCPCMYEGFGGELCDKVRLA